jgi:hypothetical protein
VQPTAAHSVTEDGRKIIFLEYASTDKSAMKSVIYDFCQQAVKMTPVRSIVRVVYATNATMIGYTEAGNAVEKYLTDSVATAASWSDAWETYLAPFVGFVVDCVTDTGVYLAEVAEGVKKATTFFSKNLAAIALGAVGLMLYLGYRRGN